MKNTLKRRIYYRDTDAGGVVYYATYLGWLEEGRTEVLRQIGISLPKIEKEQKIIFAIHDVGVKYHLPARYDDEITIETEIDRTSATSVFFRQNIFRNKDLLVEAEVRAVAIRVPEFAPARIPASLARLLES